MKKIKIRKTAAPDAEQIVCLLEELGYSNTLALVQSKIAELSKNEKDKVIVAEVDRKVVGVAHLHIAELFHQAGRLGWVMAIVVKDEFRGYGVGEKLMDSLETIARKSGCVKMEVTSSIHRSRAHEFYKNLGYREKPRRFVKVLLKKEKYENSQYSPSIKTNFDTCLYTTFFWGVICFNGWYLCQL